jgi:hypothetical protein
VPITKYVEHIDINSVSLAKLSWWLEDMTQLYEAAGLRGDDRVIPFSAGQLALPRVADVIRVQLGLFVSGYYDSSDSPASNPRMTLKSNLDYLYTNVFAPNASAPYTRSITLHLADGSTTKTSTCIVIPPFQPTQVTNRGYVYKGVLDIKIPSGVFT